MKHSAVLFLVEQIEQAACVILRPSPPPYFTTPFWIIEAINTPINIQADLLTLTTTHLKQLKEKFFSLMKLLLAIWIVQSGGKFLEDGDALPHQYGWLTPPPPQVTHVINLFGLYGYSNLL